MTNNHQHILLTIALVLACGCLIYLLIRPDLFRAYLKKRIIILIFIASICLILTLISVLLPQVNMFEWLILLFTIFYAALIVTFSYNNISTESGKFATSENLEQNVEQLEVLSAELSAQNRQLVEFANITSHNLRSPVASMKALMELYDLEKDDDEKIMLLEKVKEVIAKMDETVNDLTQVVKVRKGYNNKREQLKFSNVLASVKASIQVDLMMSKTKINTNFQVELISYPKVYLESILLNLITNAIKYRHPDRRPVIDISTEQKQNAIILIISDNGVGIDLKKHKKDIFGLNKTFHGNKDARGVGLFITKNQIESMDGSIEVESTINVGTTFKIIFNQEKV